MKEMRKNEVIVVNSRVIEKIIQNEFELKSFSIAKNSEYDKNSIRRNGVEMQARKMTPLMKSRYARFIKEDGETDYITGTLLSKLAEDGKIPFGKYMITFDKLGYQNIDKKSVYMTSIDDLNKIIKEGFDSDFDFRGISERLNPANNSIDVFEVTKKKKEVTKNSDVDDILNELAHKEEIPEGIYILKYKWEDYNQSEWGSIRKKQNPESYLRRTALSGMR